MTRRWLTALVLSLAVAPIGATTVEEILAMSESQLSRKPEGVITGIVSAVFGWHQNSCILVDSKDVDGAAVYVADMISGATASELKGARRLRVGDEVVVTGRSQAMLLEPGVCPQVIDVIGHRDLPPPPMRSPLELINGRYNNRRVAIEGVLWGSRVDKTNFGPVTIFRLGTRDGPVGVNVCGDYPVFATWRNRRVRVEGVSQSVFNARGEFLRGEVSVASGGVVRLIDTEGPPHPIDLSSTARGVLAWTARTPVCGLVQIRGEVVYRDLRERFFVLDKRVGDQPPPRRVAVRVNVADNESLPELGACGLAEGFPFLTDDNGVLEEGAFRSDDSVFGHSEPQLLPSRLLSDLFNRRIDLDEDFSYRFVRLTGRVESVRRTDDGRVQLGLATAGGALVGSLREGGENFKASDYEDRPLVELTGILDVHLLRSAFNGRILAVDSIELRLRRADDIRIVRDAESRKRKLLRLARQGVLYASVPLAGTLIAILLAGWRRRVRVAAISEDRHHTADELHDTIAQQLTGARMIIFAAKSAEDVPEETRRRLELAIDVIESARGEVRNAVLRLKSDDFTILPVETLIRRDAEAISRQIGVKIKTRLCAFPPWVTGDVKTDIISIILEAVTNAVKHGHARRIVILAERPNATDFTLSVCNDGAPFDAAAAFGPELGHFGLVGMRRRAKRHRLTISFGFRNGWTEVRLERKGQ